MAVELKLPGANLVGIMAGIILNSGVPGYPVRLVSAQLKMSCRS